MNLVVKKCFVEEIIEPVLQWWVGFGLAKIKEWGNVILGLKVREPRQGGRKQYTVEP